jgi:hypothetical protein
MHVPSEQIKWRRDQSQNASKNKRCPHSFTCRQTYQQQERGDGEAPAADSGQPDAKGNQKSEDGTSHCIRSENV